MNKLCVRYVDIVDRNQTIKELININLNNHTYFIYGDTYSPQKQFLKLQKDFNIKILMLKKYSFWSFLSIVSQNKFFIKILPTSLSKMVDIFNTIDLYAWLHLAIVPTSTAEKLLAFTKLNDITIDELDNIFRTSNESFIYEVNVDSSNTSKEVDEFFTAGINAHQNLINFAKNKCSHK